MKYLIVGLGNVGAQYDKTRHNIGFDVLDKIAQEKGVKFVTSSKNRKKRYTQINGEIAICQKANQQFNWHGDFVFESQDL